MGQHSKLTPAEESADHRKNAWFRTLRTTVLAGISLLPLLPEIAKAAGVDTVPIVATVLTVTAAIQRVVALESVQAWAEKTFTPKEQPNEGNTAHDGGSKRPDDIGPGTAME